MSNIQCKQVSEIQLQQLVDGTATDLDRSFLEEHLCRCETCQAAIVVLADPDRELDSVAPMLPQLFANSAEPVFSETPDAIKPPSYSSSSFNDTVSILVEPNARKSELANPELADSDFVTDKQNEVQLEPASHPELLGRIGDFDIEKEIGRGGCGVVYKGFDSELNRPVAIKVLAPQLASNGVARQRFAREAQAVAAVRHPNVVEIHRVSKEPARPYIVMAFVPGESLEARVRSNGPFGLLDSIRIASQIAAGLSAAHGQGLIHRDIKPANILIEHDNNRVLISDFGLARAADDAGMTQTGWLAGTPHYMSPEQAAGEPIDHRSDLFSLGSVIYFLATGREPFRAEKPFAVLQKIVNQHPTPIRDVNPDVTETLARIVDQLFEKDPNDRFESADALQKTLGQYLAHLQNPSSHAKPVLKPQRKPSKTSSRSFGSSLARAFAVVAVTAGTLAAGFFGVTWLITDSPSDAPVATFEKEASARDSLAPYDLTQPAIASTPGLQGSHLGTDVQSRISSTNQLFGEELQLNQDLESLAQTIETSSNEESINSTTIQPLPGEPSLLESIRELEFELDQFEQDSRWFDIE